MIAECRMDCRSEGGSRGVSERKATAVIHHPPLMMVLAVEGVGEGIFGKYSKWRADRIC